MLTLSGSAHPIHDSFSQPCPGHEKMASPLDFTPELQELWTAHLRERIIGSRTDAISTQFTGFSICHPVYDDKHMLKVDQHATASASSPTASFLLLPNWMENSSSAFHKICTDKKDFCTM